MGVLRHMLADWPVLGLFWGVAAAGGWWSGAGLARRPWRLGAALALAMGAGLVAGFVMRPALDGWHPFAGSPEADALRGEPAGWIVSAAFWHFDSAVYGTIGTALVWLLASLVAGRAAGQAAGPSETGEHRP